MYSGFAAIGIEIDCGKLIGSVELVRAFPHEYPEDIKFCPNTGRKLWLQRETNIKEYDSHKNTLCGLPLRGTTEDGRTVVCIATVEADATEGEFGFTKIPDLAVAKNQLREKLEPLGLWDEGSFGLYSLLSYYG